MFQMVSSVLQSCSFNQQIKRVFPVASLAFEVSTRAVRNCNQEFEQVKSQRFDRFSRCFEHVSVVIDQIYKRMCRNSGAQVRQHT